MTAMPLLMTVAQSTPFGDLNQRQSHWLTMC